MFTSTCSFVLVHCCISVGCLHRSVPVVVMAMAGAALLLLVRDRDRAPNVRRPRVEDVGGAGPDSGGRSGRASGRRSLRDANRPRKLAAVRRLTIGSDAEGGALFTLSAAPPPASTVSSPLTAPPSGGASAGGGSSSGPMRLTLRPEVVPALCALASTVELYLLTRVSSDEGETEVVSALVDSGVIAAGMNVHKALFCETVEGRVSMVRQLEPQLALDEAPGVVNALGRFVKRVQLLDWTVGDDGVAQTGPGRTTLQALLEE
eukprot:TRINITY_DN2945_c0_g1_i5.p1 TRINITY_DN2945_c0_g1~~TRINITY_DN2945_c0_g1_i5.p1  ORF type:complete len:262 (+),score=34.41 TRINITY_DN2945_c0_g1_i5:818-1603(+)